MGFLSNLFGKTNFTKGSFEAPRHFCLAVLRSQARPNNLFPYECLIPLIKDGNFTVMTEKSLRAFVAKYARARTYVPSQRDCENLTGLARYQDFCEGAIKEGFQNEPAIFGIAYHSKSRPDTDGKPGYHAALIAICQVGQLCKVFIIQPDTFEFQEPSTEAADVEYFWS